MIIEHYMNLKVDYVIIPAHEGTTDEIIPETIDITSVKIGDLEIKDALSQEDIDILIENVSNEILT